MNRLFLRALGVFGAYAVSGGTYSWMGLEGAPGINDLDGGTNTGRLTGLEGPSSINVRDGPATGTKGREGPAAPATVGGATGRDGPAMGTTELGGDALDSVSESLSTSYTFERYAR